MTSPNAALTTILAFLLLTTTTAFAANENFSLDPNGVTIHCDNAAVGETGSVGGTSYSKISAKEDLSLYGGDVAASLACTSGVTDMSSWFKGQSTFNEDYQPLGYNRRYQYDGNVFWGWSFFPGYQSLVRQRCCHRTLRL